jgi:hypothetical protein
MTVTCTHLRGCGLLLTDVILELALVDPEFIPRHLLQLLLRELPLLNSSRFYDFLVLPGFPIVPPWLSIPTVSPFWVVPNSGYPFAAKVGQIKPPNWANSKYRN